jgi:hypothetical protein
MTTLTKKRTGKAIFYTSSIVASLLILGYIYYLELSAYRIGVKPPLGKSLSFVEKIFSAEKGIVFHQATGTHLVIPPDALIDENGEKVRGKVTLKFREYQNAYAIFQSGIPMLFGENRTDYFSSLGMFELRAFQNGKEVELKKDAAVQVELAAAIAPDADFKMYFLSEELNWDNGKFFEVVENNRRDAALVALPEIGMKPMDPNLDTAGFNFEIVSDYTNMPHLKIWKDIRWTVKESDEKLPVEQAIRLNWDKINISKAQNHSNLFHLDFESMQTDYTGRQVQFTYSILAAPQLTGNELANATRKYEADLTAYNLAFGEIVREEERLKLESGVLSKFEINEFGIYNIDKLKDTEILAQVEMEFDFEKELIPEINKVMLYVIMEKERTVLNFNAFDWDKIPLLDAECALVAVLPSGKVAYVSKENFKAVIEANPLSSIRENKLFFKTEKLDYDEVEDLIERILTPSRFV